jgi:hypothetical protein
MSDWVEETIKRLRKQIEVLEAKKKGQRISAEEKAIFVRGCWDDPSSELPHCYNTKTQDECQEH